MKSHSETGKEPKKNPPKKNARGLFVAGNNGGRGRPMGSLDRRTAPFRAKIDEAMPDILASVIKAAQDGDIQAARILLDKTLPSLKPIEVARPFPIVGDTLTAKAASLIQATAAGAISVDEAIRLLQAMAAVAGVVKSDNVVERKIESDAIDAALGLS